MLRGSGCSFGKNLRTFLSGPPRFQSSFFSSPPFFLEIRDSSYISKENPRQTNHFRLQPQSVAPSGSTPPTVLSSSSHLHSKPSFVRALNAGPTPWICFYTRVMTRGSAQLCSLGTKSVWNPDGGRTAAEISCDSDLLLLLQDLCRACSSPAPVARTHWDPIQLSLSACGQTLITAI